MKSPVLVGVGVVLIVVERELGLVVLARHIQRRVHHVVKLHDGKHDGPALRRLVARVEPLLGKRPAHGRGRRRPRRGRRVEDGENGLAGAVPLDMGRHGRRGRAADGASGSVLLVGEERLVRRALHLLVVLLAGTASAKATAVEKRAQSRHRHHAHGREGAGNLSFGVEERVLLLGLGQRRGRGRRGFRDVLGQDAGGGGAVHGYDGHDGCGGHSCGCGPRQAGLGNQRRSRLRVAFCSGVGGQLLRAR